MAQEANAGQPVRLRFNSTEATLVLDGRTVKLEFNVAGDDSRIDLLKLDKAREIGEEIAALKALKQQRATLTSLEHDQHRKDIILLTITAPSDANSGKIYGVVRDRFERYEEKPVGGIKEAPPLSLQIEQGNGRCEEVDLWTDRAGKNSDGYGRKPGK